MVVGERSPNGIHPFQVFVSSGVRCFAVQFAVRFYSTSELSASNVYACLNCVGGVGVTPRGGTDRGLQDARHRMQTMNHRRDANGIVQALEKLLA